MKRLYVLTFLLGLALTTLVSQGTFAEETTPPVQNGPAFVDEDGNGICDNYENGGRGLARGRGAGIQRNFVDADGDGKCDNFTNGRWLGAGRGKGIRGGARANFVDADGDGVCDNYGTRPNFVDADGDGVCDNYGTGKGMRRNGGRNRGRVGTPSENAQPSN